MSDQKQKPMWFCQWHRLFHHAETQCEGQEIIDRFEQDRKAGKNPAPIDYKKEIPQ